MLIILFGGKDQGVMFDPKLSIKRTFRVHVSKEDSLLDNVFRMTHNTISELSSDLGPAILETQNLNIGLVLCLCKQLMIVRVLS